MQVIPKIIINGNEYNLSARELILLSNRRYTKFRGKLFELNENNSFKITDKGINLKKLDSDAIDALDSLASYNEVNAVTEDHTDSENIEIPYPRDKFLSEMCFMGIDEAAKCLLNKKSTRTNQRIFSAAMNSRSRYLVLAENYSINANYNLISINKSILNFPFRYFVRPLGKGEFRNLETSIDRSISIKAVTDYINNYDNTFRDKFEKISNFKAQAIASIFFHNQIFFQNETHIETDSLSYIFKRDDTQFDVIEKLKKLKKNINNTTLNRIQNDIKLFKSLKCLTLDAISNLSVWQKTSFEKFVFEASNFPRKLSLSKERINIDNTDYPKKASDHSIFCISASSNDRGISEKCRILHKVGLRKIENISLFTSDFSFIFKIQKNKLLRISEII